MQKFKVVITPTNRQELAERCMEAVLAAPEGYVVDIKAPTRNLDQNAKLHAICSDLARQKEFGGRFLTVDQWKVLLVSGHAVATGQGAEVFPGLEGEFVNIRESTASMTVKRLASLIEYAIAYAAQNGVKLQERT
jgi:hypothetical protein